MSWSAIQNSKADAVAEGFDTVTAGCDGKL